MVLLAVDPVDDQFDFLIRRWWPMVRGLARDVELPGMETQDVEQEGLIALMEAARRYDPARGVPFARFASIVVRLRWRDLATKASRGKHSPLNDSIVEVTNADGGKMTLLEFLADRAPEPDRVAFARDRLHLLALAIENDLTAAERISLRGIMNGLSYDEIANEINVGGSGRRYVDNAVQRARRKLRDIGS